MTLVGTLVEERQFVKHTGQQAHTPWIQRHATENGPELLVAVGIVDWCHLAVHNYIGRYYIRTRTSCCRWHRSLVPSRRCPTGPWPSLARRRCWRPPIQRARQTKPSANNFGFVFRHRRAGACRLSNSVWHVSVRMSVCAHVHAHICIHFHTHVHT